MTVVLAFATVAAGNLGNSSFDAGDGNLVVDGQEKDWATSGLVDCVSATKKGCGLDQPTGQNDDSFGQGTDENEPNPTVVAGSIPNNKSDLTRFYVANDKVGSDEFLYLAWERVQEPTGSTNMDFEFNKNKCVLVGNPPAPSSDSSCSTNNRTPARTKGDLLVMYDLSNGGTNPSIAFSRWVIAEAGVTAAAACEAGNKLPCWGKRTSIAAGGGGSTGNFEASVNTAPVDDPIAPDATRSLSARTFGEAAINLSGSGIFGSNVCQTFGSAYLKSRSSDSFTAAAKDFISPIPVVISNCGSITLKKVTEPAGSTQTFAFAASGSPSTLSPAAPSLSGAAGSDTQVYSNLQAGSYTFTEGNQLAATWDLATSISCKLADGITDASFTSGERTATVSLAASQAVTCTFTNSRKPTLTVNKVCVPAADSGKFDLKIGSTVYKADATCAGGAASSTGAVPLSAGNYSVSEAAGTGTSLSNYAQLIGGDCAADGSVSLAAGENKVCSITNSRKPTLTVNKVCVPAADSGKFDLKIGSTVYKADATCAGGAASSTGAVVLDPGSYSVSEAAGTGTSLSNYAQLIGGDCAADGSVSLAAGENKVCSITNSRKPTLTVNKVCVPAADSGKFDLKIGSTVYKADATCAGGAASSTGAVVLDPGSYSVSEAAGTGTSLSNYAQLIGGDCAADGSVSLAAGENKVCSITNSRKPTLTVNKVCVPAADSGLFKLQIDGTAFGGNASNDSACGGSTGAQVVSTGSHTVSEAAGANTSLSHYTSVINGDCSAAGAVSLAYGENKTCTITNTKRVFKLIVLVCEGNSLYRSEVTLTNGVPSPGTKTLVSPPAGVTAAELCGLGGAAYDVGIGSFAPSVTIGAAQAAP